jgi:hypothetical protein
MISSTRSDRPPTQPRQPVIEVLTAIDSLIGNPNAMKAALEFQRLLSKQDGPAWRLPSNR